MKRTAVLRRVRRAARDAGVPYEVVELTNHTGIVVGGVRSTLGRHSEIDDVTGAEVLRPVRVGAREGVVAVTRYTVTAERGRRWWVLQCVEHPGAISEVARLDQAATVMREAIAFVAQVDPSDVEVDLRPAVPDEVGAHVRTAERLRAEAHRANREAAVESRAAARVLRDAGLSVRDVGTVLGVSHQRAHQLLAG